MNQINVTTKGQKIAEEETFTTLAIT